MGDAHVCHKLELVTRRRALGGEVARHYTRRFIPSLMLLSLSIEKPNR